MKNIKEKLSFCLLIAVYLVVSYRYFPDRLTDSLYHTLKHMLSVAPFTFGITLVVSAIFHKATGQRLPWDRAARIFFTIGIIIELFFGIHNYLSMV